MDSSPPQGAKLLRSTDELINMLMADMPSPEKLHGAGAEAISQSTGFHQYQSQTGSAGTHESTHSTQRSGSGHSPNDIRTTGEPRELENKSRSRSVDTIHTASSGPVEYEETTLKLKITDQARIGLIHDWEMLVVMDPSKSSWTYLTPENSLFRRNSRHLRLFPLDSIAPNSDISLPRAAARFMSFRASDIPDRSETGIRLTIGHLLADLLSSEQIPAN